MAVMAMVSTIASLGKGEIRIARGSITARALKAVIKAPLRRKSKVAGIIAMKKRIRSRLCLVKPKWRLG